MEDKAATHPFTVWDNKISSSSSSSNSDAAPSMKMKPPHTASTSSVTNFKGFLNLDKPVGNSTDNLPAANFVLPLHMFPHPPPPPPPSASVYSTTSKSKSPAGGDGGGGFPFPFTCAQWGELERQAMIYKYIMCCVPVPPELLFPGLLPRNSVAATGSPVYNVRYAARNGNGDPEPGRCKRTDGKKWRCSRDVAPHHKYCDRHLHRGRPRSRKPVELLNKTTTAACSNTTTTTHKKTRLHQPPRPVSLQASTTASSHQLHLLSAASSDSPLLLFNSKTDVNASKRDFRLMMEAGMVNVNTDDHQPWQLLMGSNIGSSSIHGSTTVHDQDYLDQRHHHHHPLNMFAAPEIQAQSGFIDAWSIDNNNLNSTTHGNTEFPANQGNLSPSLNLSMAMAVGNPLDQGLGKVQLESYTDHHSEDWSGRHVSWQPFAQGGPLAEALHLGSVYANPASPHDSFGTPATTVSSPSGVLQRTFFSHSDSSVCNSPTFAAHASEVAFPRFNHND